jgi:signal transduction histidine kinase
MVTLALTLVIYRRYRDWRVLPLTLFFLWATVQQTATSAAELLALSPPGWVHWLAATPLAVPTFLGFAAVVYLWRVFQVQADLQRRERELAERALRAQRFESLGVMAAGVAHDFNTLLTTILGNTSLVLMDVPEGSETAASARSIQQAAERAAAISRQMLDYSGCGKFRVEPVDLAALATRMRPLLESFLPERVTLVIEGASDPPPVVAGDASQLEQVLVNLVSNAAEATTGPGTLTLRTALVDADEALLADGANSDPLTPGRYALLSVEDTGSGMDEATRQRMFDPFFSTRAVGRGMGLAAVLGIVRGHHGTLRVRTAPGKGTCVDVLLPAAAEAATGNEAGGGGAA